MTRATIVLKTALASIVIAGCSGRSEEKPDFPLSKNVASSAIDAGTSSPTQAPTQTAVAFCGRTWPEDSTSISCHDQAVSDLRPLERLVRLKEINVSGTQVSNLEPIAKLEGLEALRVDDTPVKNLEPLSTLTNLRALDLGGTKTSRAEIEKLQAALPKLWIVVPQSP